MPIFSVFRAANRFAPWNVFDMMEGLANARRIPDASHRTRSSPQLSKANLMAAANKPSQTKKPARKKPDRDPRGERLQKVLAAAGVASRRECEELIVTGRIEVDGEVVDQLGARVDPDSQEIRFDGEALKIPRRLYYLVNKPSGLLCTNRDPQGRSRVIDLIPAGNQRLFTVGRLDKESRGLLLVTNDGDLAHRLTHPRFGVEKVYRVQVAGVPSRETIEQLRRGVRLSDGIARVPTLVSRSSHKKSAELEIRLREGRNRVIRRVLAHVGHKVLTLRRVSLGPLKLKGLEPGEVRPLYSGEHPALRQYNSQETRKADPENNNKPSDD
ncbi:MAG: rRNA pseudouridine synthase, partial [Planctomycetales bacterium]